MHIVSHSTVTGINQIDGYTIWHINSNENSYCSHLVCEIVHSGRYQHFRGIYCLHFQSESESSLKNRCYIEVGITGASTHLYNHLLPQNLFISTLKMEAIYSCEQMVPTYWNIKCHNAEWVAWISRILESKSEHFTEITHDIACLLALAPL